MRTGIDPTPHSPCSKSPLQVSSQPKVRSTTQRFGAGPGRYVAVRGRRTNFHRGSNRPGCFAVTATRACRRKPPSAHDHSCSRGRSPHHARSIHQPKPRPGPGNVGRMVTCHRHGATALGINHDMTLAPGHLLARVVSPSSRRFFGGLHTLAVHDAEAGLLAGTIALPGRAN